MTIAANALEWIQKYQVEAYSHRSLTHYSAGRWGR